MDNLELRIARLEQVNARYRVWLSLSLAALTVFCLAGFDQVTRPQQQGYPQNIVADSITVRSVNAVNAMVNQLGTTNATVQYLNLVDGRAEGLSIKLANVATLQAQRAALGRAAATQIDVTTPNGAGVVIGSSGDSGSVTVVSREGQPLSRISGSDSSGSLQLFGNTGFVGVEAKVEQKGGFLRLINSKNRDLITLKRASQGDGEIATCNDSGNRLVVIRAEDDQKSGKVIVHKEGAFPMVTLGINDKGGLVQTRDEKNETARLPAK